MKKLRRLFLWTLFFLAVAIICDQLLLQTRPTSTGVRAFRDFYIDFRTRLVGLVGEKTPASIDQVIEKSGPGHAPPAGPAGSQRYIYVDGQGQLQFADSLQEIPKAFRAQAQPLKD